MGANAISLIGSWIHRIAFAWIAWELTHSPFWLGIIAGAGMVSVLLAGPLGGVLADRFDQRRQIALTQFLAFLLMLALYFVYEAGRLDLAMLIAFRVALTILVSLAQPARLVLVPRLVAPEHLAAAVSTSSLAFNLARLVGPAVAGLLLASGNAGPAFLINGCSYLGLVVVMQVIGTDTSVPAGRARGPLLRDLGGSFGYLSRHRAVASVFVLYALCAVAGRSVVEMVPAIVDSVFGRGVDGLAIITSAMALGSLVGGFLSLRQSLTGITSTMIASIAGYGACVAAFIWLPGFWFATALLTVASGVGVTMGVAGQTLVQTAVDPDYRGRVMSLWFVLSRGGPALGALLTGAGSELIGLPAMVTLGGGLCVAVAALAWRQRVTLARELEIDGRTLAATGR